jgi:hypothetical protein
MTAIAKRRQQKRQKILKQPTKYATLDAGSGTESRAIAQTIATSQWSVDRFVVDILLVGWMFRQPSRWQLKYSGIMAQ